jgi:L,D-transpeptidase ErfK/SrfK
MIKVTDKVARNAFFGLSVGVAIALALAENAAIAIPTPNQPGVINNNSTPTTGNPQLPTPYSNPPSSPNLANPAPIPTGNPQIPTSSSPSPASPNLANPTTNPLQKMRLVLRLKERRLYVYRGEKLEGNYLVAIGKPGWETPTGNFRIIQMIKDPAWAHPFKKGVVIPPGPTNPLGRRWVAFWTDGTNSIGFHGTPNESVMGKAVSHGCVRMRNKDVVALYDKIALGASVTVEQ